MKVRGPVCSGPSPQTLPAEEQRQCLIIWQWPLVHAGEAVLYGWIEAVREHLQDSIPDEAARASPDSEFAANVQLQVVCRRFYAVCA